MTRKSKSADKLADVLKQLSTDLNKISFSSPVSSFYNPLVYAWLAHEQYLKKFAGSKQIVLLGMNPGPFGMAQTGIPFGEVHVVRDWLKITAEIGKPVKEHPKRPILGFSCERSEVSGRRLWGWAQERFSTPQHFFSRFFVINFCPLVFMTESGANITPDKLASAERHKVFSLCDRALVEQVEILQSHHLIGIGKFAEKRLQTAFKGEEKKIGWALHPSPASPAANRGWQAQFEAQLAEMNIVY